MKRTADLNIEFDTDLKNTVLGILRN